MICKTNKVTPKTIEYSCIDLIYPIVPSVLFMGLLYCNIYSKMCSKLLKWECPLKFRVKLHPIHSCSIYLKQIHNRLVVSDPLKNLSSSIGMMTFPTEWENRSRVPVTTNQTNSTSNMFSAVLALLSSFLSGFSSRPRSTQ